MLITKQCCAWAAISISIRKAISAPDAARAADRLFQHYRPLAVVQASRTALLFPQHRQTSLDRQALHRHFRCLLAIQYRLDDIWRQEGKVDNPADTPISDADPRRDLAEL
jgi:hypothetical protein